MSKTAESPAESLQLLDEMEFLLSLSQSRKDSLLCKLGYTDTRVRDIICSKRKHSSLMELWFNVQATGPDLGNIEIKENINIRHEYVVSIKDLDADFLLFYDHRLTQWALLHKNLIKHLIHSQRSMSHALISKYSQILTKNDAIIMHRIKEICTHPELLKF